MAKWTRELPTAPGIFDHRNLENAKGRAPINERVVFVGYVNWTEDKQLGHGTKPTLYMPHKLRACRIDQPMTTDSLTVQEWSGEWRRIDGAELQLYGRHYSSTDTCGVSASPSDAKRRVDADVKGK